MKDRYGRLLVLKYWREGDYRCRLTVCDCGNFNLFKTKHQFKRNSCGCLVTESIDNMVKNIKKTTGVSAFNEVYASYVRSAKLRGYEFSLSKCQFKHLTSQDCFYCGNEPSNELIREKRNGGYTYNGLDRVDSDVGYILTNVVPCCKMCNGMKMALPVEQFISHIEKMLSCSPRWLRTA